MYKKQGIMNGEGGFRRCILQPWQLFFYQRAVPGITQQAYSKLEKKKAIGEQMLIRIMQSMQWTYADIEAIHQLCATIPQQKSDCNTTSVGRGTTV